MDEVDMMSRPLETGLAEVVILGKRCKLVRDDG